MNLIRINLPGFWAPPSNRHFLPKSRINTMAEGYEYERAHYVFSGSSCLRPRAGNPQIRHALAAGFYGNRT